jgi:predicted metalloprotease
MDWTPGELSSDIEDRRGSSGGGGGFGGGGLGIVGFLVLLVISLVTGRNYIGSYLSGGGAVSSQRSQSMTPDGRPYAASPAEDRSAHLVSFTLDDVQKTWAALLP